jgi:hypothetical protein
LSTCKKNRHDFDWFHSAANLMLRPEAPRKISHAAATIKDRSRFPAGFQSTEAKMKKAALILATAATLVASSMTTSAEARGWGRPWGPGLAFGLAAGAIAASVAGPYGYGPYYRPAYYGSPYYYGPRYVFGPRYAYGPRFYRPAYYAAPVAYAPYAYAAPVDPWYAW